MPRKRCSDENIVSVKKKRHIENNGEVANVPRNNLSIRSAESQRSGKLMRIHLTNFMCHANLMVDFNNRVNLLIGSNGSGKSAILTALVVGLGSRANKTNRSTNLKNLIKTGENSTTIEIDIANNGVDSFDFETYGSKITVERKLLASGGSNYKIKNERGQLVSKNRDDLMKILLYHNIQTDNPVFVLNQDAARTFLKDLDPIKNYTLFLKATQMELILDKLQECSQMYNTYKAKLGVSKTQLQVYEDEVEELRQKYERLQSVAEIESTIIRHKLERSWLTVSKHEDIVEQIHQDIEHRERERNEVNEKINKNNGEDDIQQILRVLQKQVDERNLAIQKENRLLNELRDSVKEENTKFQIEAQQRSKLKSKCNHCESQIKTIEKDMSERTESCSSRNSRLRQENEEKLERLDKKRSDVTALIASVKQELTHVNHNKERQTEEYQTLNLQKTGAQSKISANQQELNKIATSSNDRIEIYGQHMKSLLDAIDRAHKSGKFTAKPKGPMGRYLQVPDRKWRGPVEYFLSGILNSFVVNNAKDRAVLDNIIKTNCRARHTIITTKFRDSVYDVRTGSVPKIKGAHLLMDLIKCSDPVVTNCIIDQVHSERILLVDDKDLAIALTSEVSQVPQNLLKVISLNPFMEYFPAPIYRAYSLNPRNPRYIEVNVDDRKLTLQEEIRNSEEFRKEIDAKLQKLRKLLGDSDEYSKQKMSLLRKHESSLEQLKLQVEELNKFEYPSENEDEILRTELITLNNNIKTFLAQIKEKETICMELKQTILEKDKGIKKQQEKIRTIEDELNSFTEELQGKRYDMTTMDNNLRIWKTKLDKIDHTISQLKCDAESEAERLSEYEQSAREMGERIDTDKSDSELHASIKSMETRLKELSASGENIDEVKALFDDKCLTLQGNRACIDSLIEVLNLLKRSSRQRFKTMKYLQEHMALRVSHTFKQLLKIRNFEGELEIDHLARTLKISIVPRDKHIENAVSSTKSLSGGERSYATVTLLLSLWSCVDHAFYFLDEYDVFTDQLNREIMTKLLLNEAEKKPHRQYTFLTPQDISFVQPSDTVKIHRLSDPHRQETA